MLEDLTRFVVLDCIGSTEYQFPFKIFHEEHLLVIRISADGKIYTPLTLNSDYTVSGEAGKFSYGGVVTTTHVFSNGQLYIGRTIPLHQQAHFPDTGRFPAGPVEAQFDKMVMMIQEIDHKVQTALRVPLGEEPLTELAPVELRRGGYMFFRESDGKPISVTNMDTESLPVTGFVAPALQSETNEEFISYIGAVGRFLPEMQQSVLRMLSYGMRGQSNVLLSDISGLGVGTGNTLNIPPIRAIMRDTTEQWYHYVEIAQQTDWVPNQLFQDNYTFNYLCLSVDSEGTPTLSIEGVFTVSGKLLLGAFLTQGGDITYINSAGYYGNSLERIEMSRHQRGHLELTLTNTSPPEILAGSVVEVVGILHEFPVDTLIPETLPAGDHEEAWIRVIPWGHNRIVPEYTLIAPVWSDSKRGWYGEGVSENYRYLARLRKVGLMYSEKQLLQSPAGNLFPGDSNTFESATIKAEPVRNGNTELFSTPGYSVRSTASVSEWIFAFGQRFPFKGTLTLKYTLSRTSTTTGPGNPAKIRIYRNGLFLTAAEVEAPPPGVTMARNQYCEPGDLFTMFIQAGGAGARLIGVAWEFDGNWTSAKAQFYGWTSDPGIVSQLSTVMP